MAQGEPQFQLLVESVKDYAIFMLDPRGHIISWNQGARRIKGYTEAEVLGKSFSIFYTPEDQARGLPARGLEIAATEGRYETEGWRVRKDGATFWADVVMTALRDGEGQLVGFAKVTRDLTDRRRAEEEHDRLIAEQASRMAAEEAEERIRAILNSITDGFFAFTYDFRFTFVNTRTTELIQALHDHPPGNLIGRVMWEALPGLVGTRFEREYRRVIEERGPVHFEEFFAPSGRWFEAHAFPVTGGASVYFRDVTARKRIERERAELLERLAAERAWLDAVIEQSPVAIFRVEGPEGERIVANRQAERLFGRPLPAEGGVAQYISQICRTDGTPLSWPELATERALRGQTVGNEEQLIRRPNGQEVRVMVRATPIRRAGRTAGAVVVYDDITEIRQLERQREEWTSIIAHDLRQPVATITGYGGILRRSLGARAGPREQSAIEHILTAAWNLNKMIGDLLDISQIEGQNLSLDQTAVNLPVLVADVVERTGVVMNRHPVRIEVRGQVPRINADPARVEQVLGNLLSNAAKYGEPDTEILVTVDCRDGAEEIAVTNRGAGIPPDEMPRLFNRFYRSREARTSGARGLGLGLYISKCIIEAHGGQIWAESTPGQTTTFHFTLPITAPAS